MSGSISELVARSNEEPSRLTVSDTGKVLHWVNSANKSLVVFDVLYYWVSGVSAN